LAGSKPTITEVPITRTGVVIYPRLFSSSEASPSLVMSLSSNWMFFCERYSFRLAAEHSTRLGINYDSLHTEQQFPEKRAA
jgi:hypothetical protein